MEFVIPVFLLALVLFVRGLGLGAVLVPILSSAYTGLSRDQFPHASMFTRGAQQLGGAIGVAAVALHARTAAQARPGDLLTHHRRPISASIDPSIAASSEFALGGHLTDERGATPGGWLLAITSDRALYAGDRARHGGGDDDEFPLPRRSRRRRRPRVGVVRNRGRRADRGRRERGWGRRFGDLGRRARGSRGRG